jgi:DNA polymerase-3 subunit beta
MKLIILRTNLIDGLNSVERAISESSNLPILKNILIKIDGGSIVFISTNLELAVECIVPGKVIEKGEITIPFSIFNSIIKNLNSERISLEEKNKKVVISTDNYEAVIQGQDPKEFPIIPPIINKNKKLKINTNDFKEALGSVIVAAQYSDIRPEISGVFFNHSDNIFTLVATDSFRLSERKIDTKLIQTDLDDFSAIIPLKTASELMRFFSKDEILEISIDPNQILFSTKNEKIISRLIDGNFPDYKAVVPKQTQNEVVVDRNELINALKLASAFAGRANNITLKIGDGKKTIEVYSVDNSLGENCYKIPIKLKGEKFSLVFNWKYLLDGLKIYKNNEVVLGVNSPDRPVVIKTPTEPQLIYVAMPIKS